MSIGAKKAEFALHQRLSRYYRSAEKVVKFCCKVRGCYIFVMECKAYSGKKYVGINDYNIIRFANTKRDCIKSIEQATYKRIIRELAS